ncbi:hypothetical protein SDC9_66692 [bioreactor metagenome]|uniref:Uncharacterized protein n=1 Tax=bioreactor metagenome TaxID=1076179 RepID=A0A644Y148_9ZZZZ
MDQFFDDLCRIDQPVLVTFDCLCQHLREFSSLYHIHLTACFDLIIEQSFEQFKCQISAIHALNFSQEFIGEDGNIRFTDAGRVKYVDHFTGNNGVVDDLPDSGLNFFIGSGFGGFIKFGKAGFDCLEKGQIITDFKGFGVGDR